MRLTPQSIGGLYLVETDSHADDRGVFRRSYCQHEFARHNVEFEVCQSNISLNPKRHTLRGFHYQTEPTREKKLISIATGEIFHAVIDVRSESDTYLEVATFNLSADEGTGLLVGEGLASAFLTMVDDVVVHYLMADFFDSQRYVGIRYDDPLFGVDWPVEPAHISERDRAFSDFDPLCV